MIVLTDPGFRQEPRQIAAALSERGTPFVFRTSTYLSPASRVVRIAAALPGRLGHGGERLWRARYQPQIDRRAVSNAFFPDVMRVGLDRLGVSPGARNLFVNASFDRYAAARLNASCSVAVAMQGTALATIRKARRLGAVSVVVANTPHSLTEARLVAAEEHRLGLRKSAVPGPAQRVLSARIDRELSEADVVVCGSAFERDDLVEHGLDPEKLRLVQLGVDTDLFRPRTSRPDRGTAIALYVGGLNSRKGVVHLAEAVRLLRRDGVAVVAETYGAIDKRYAPVVAPFIDAGVLRAHPPVPYRMLADVYRSADVFVLPTLSDGFGLVAYEAMACGIPTIVTSRTGACVRDGIDGLVVPHGDPHALRDAIGRVLADDSLADRMGLEGSRTAQGQSWSRYRSEVAELLDGLCHPESRSAVGRLATASWNGARP